MREKRSETVFTTMWIFFLNHFGLEDEEQAMRMEKKNDLAQTSDLAAGSSKSRWIFLPSRPDQPDLPHRPKAEKASSRGGRCSSKKEELRVSCLLWSVFPA